MFPGFLHKPYNVKLPINLCLLLEEWDHSLCLKGSDVITSLWFLSCPISPSHLYPGTSQGLPFLPIPGSYIKKKKKKWSTFGDPWIGVTEEVSQLPYPMTPSAGNKPHRLCQILLQHPPKTDEGTAANWDVWILCWILTCRPNYIKALT